MHLLDPKFLANWRSYMFQCVFVAATMAIVLILLDSLTQTVLIASLGASSFIAFSVPSLRASRPRSMIGGYVVGALVGCGLSMLEILLAGIISLDAHSIEILLGAVAVGLSMFIMVTTDTEHPPAAALALGFVLNEWDLMTVVVVLVGICAISAVKEAALSRLIDLN